VYDRERHERVAAARRAEQQAMLEYVTTTECRLVFLRRMLDDPDPTPCGRCDVCSGLVWSADVSADAAAEAAERLSRPGVEIAPRKMWPSGMQELEIPVSGRLTPAELAEPGRAIGRLSDIGWGTRLRELLAGPDRPVPADLLDAVVRVLAGWEWAERPVGVVGIGSRTRPGQLAHLARRIAEIGRLPLLGTLDPVGERPGAHENSAQRLAAVWAGLGPAPALQVSGPVLLVDDVVDSGWTMTVAARALRRAGAPAVLPLALALTG
jgi:ATP-dependent DNA helicase RecQ